MPRDVILPPRVTSSPSPRRAPKLKLSYILLLFNIKPDKVKYKHKLMRSYLIKIFEINIIEHFPQDPQYVAQKVFPLAVIKIRETEAIRKLMIHQSEMDQQKSNRLKKKVIIILVKKNLIKHD